MEGRKLTDTYHTFYNNNNSNSIIIIQQGPAKLIIIMISPMTFECFYRGNARVVRLKCICKYRNYY